MVSRLEVVNFLNNLFEVENYKDASLNGLQVEGGSQITGICLGVDACEELVDGAIVENLNFIVVHHGFFWGHQFPIKGIWKNRMKKLLCNDISLYACHLPMDANKVLGHNSAIAELLQLRNIEPFGHYKGVAIGFSGELQKPTDLKEVNNMLKDKLNIECKCLNFGQNEIKTIGIVSGGGASEDILTEVKDKNIDLFITGETEHSVFHLIKEMKLNVAFAGHYETEKFALLKLEKVLKEKFQVPVKFFYIPTKM
jgi:dinuclear metal center YbgI/SA1388 family protein